MTCSEMTDADRAEVAEFIERHWHSKVVMSRGRAFYPHQEQGLIERVEGKIVALLTYRIDDQGMEILTLNSLLEGHGTGSSMMLEVIEIARRRNCPKLWLTTTNDNLKAISFYQRLGFRMTAIHLGVVDDARKVKPQIPLHGERGVEIHDEIVMALSLKPYLEAGGGR
jgi:GNAT superfamily N-acetyltransferase